MLPLLVLALGLLAAVLGIACLSVPAALIVGGLLIAGAAFLLIDFDKLGGDA